MQKGKIIFTGHFIDYFLKCIGLTILTICTFGLFWPYFSYWKVKYLVSNLEIELD
jgi:uncharacterized membrane protein YjgN (DUF898 family)